MPRVVRRAPDLSDPVGRLTVLLARSIGLRRVAGLLRTQDGRIGVFGQTRKAVRSVALANL